MHDEFTHERAEAALRTLKLCLWRMQRTCALDRDRRGYDAATQGLESAASVERALRQIRPRRPAPESGEGWPT